MAFLISSKLSNHAFSTIISLAFLSISTPEEEYVVSFSRRLKRNFGFLT
jgi:hypothetical protein